MQYIPLYGEPMQEDGMPRGEVRTVFSRKHSDIEMSGKKMCTDHKWRKLNNTEIECINCPTALIVGVDDERLK